MWPLRALYLLLCVGALAFPAWGAAPGAGPGGRSGLPARAARAAGVDTGRRLDVNRISLSVTNVGALGSPTDYTYPGALNYPKGSGQWALFAGGLRLGGRVGGQTRVTVAYYESEFGPGAMVAGVADDPGWSVYRVYKVSRWTGHPADSAHVERSAAERTTGSSLDSIVHHGWSEYMAGAVPYGAPWRLYRLPNPDTADPADSVDVPGPDVLGDQMLWCVFNDADPYLHTVNGGMSAPLGIEVRQTTFAYDRPGPLGSAAFIRYQLFNRGSNTITEMRTTMWGDFDIGGSHDDLAGCMESRSLGYMRNVERPDVVYGNAAPALGFDLVSEHDSAVLGRRTGMDAFVMYRDDSVEPLTAQQSFHVMQGLNQDGTPITDPTTGQTTTFMVTGDPVSGSGWLDEFPADQRIHCSSGPWSLAPGDSLTFWVALVVGQAETQTGSVATLRCADDYVQSVFDAGFVEPFPAPPACDVPPANCPRSSDWWGREVAAGTAFTPAEWLAIAHHADSTSVVFDFAPGSIADYRAALTGPWPTARDSAQREYLALLSNVAADVLGLVPDDGELARLSRGTWLVIPPLVPGSVATMIQDQPDSIRLFDAHYQIGESSYGRAYTGVEAGLSQFFGGAGTGWESFGGTLNPGTMPDSFATVELRFSYTATQKAYRYFRLEQADGTPPAGGRAYPYGGYHAVNLQAWDMVHNRQLDLAFVERMVTDAGGTYRPLSQQPSAQDSTWDPSTDSTGDYEQLFVLNRPYSPTPKPAIAANGALLNGSLPLLYELWARRRSTVPIVGDGDGFRFLFGYPPTGSAERLFQWLEPRPLSDTSVVSQYRAFAAHAADVNRGLGIGAVCGDAVPVAGALIEARTEGGYVTLRWQLAMPASAARLESRSQYGAWLDQGPASLEGGQVTARDYLYNDAGPRWYRLAIAAPIGLARTDSVSLVAGEAPPPLALVAVWPNPSVDGQPRMEFTLPERGTVRLEVYDLAGRRVSERELPGMDAGTQYVEVAPGARLRPGVYFVRLQFGNERRTSRFVVLE